MASYDDDPDDDPDSDLDDPDGPDGYDEPIGSCEWCGVNLYPGDDIDLCDQCAWHAEANRDRREREE